MSREDDMELLEWGVAELAAAGIATARSETALLLERCPDAELFRCRVKRRASRYPLQYILRDTEFMGLPFKLREGVFIPRPETEILVEKTAKIADDMGRGSIDVLEIGTGSGNIAISLTKNVTNCRILASDISDEALETASENAEMNAVGRRIRFIKSDLFHNISAATSGYFDIIISNPPYVRRSEIKQLQPEISYEDARALDGGIDGLDFYRKILDEGRQHLKAGGIFAFEIGHDQAASITEIAKRHPELGGIEIFKDYNGLDRIAIIVKHG